MTDGEREMSPRSSILLGIVLAVVGLGIVAAARWAPERSFHAPRWVLASGGGAFLFFGSYLAVIYALGYDPRRGEETLPPPLVQLAFFLPGMTFLALPFHWVAFAPGPRAFSGSVSLPFISVSGRYGALSGRILFGIGAVLMDIMITGTTVSLLRRAAKD